MEFNEIEELVESTVSYCDIVGIIKEVSPEAEKTMKGEISILGRALDEETDFYTVLVKGRVIIRDYKHLDKKSHQGFVEVHENGSIVFEYKNVIITMKQLKESGGD